MDRIVAVASSSSASESASPSPTSSPWPDAHAAGAQEGGLLAEAWARIVARHQGAGEALAFLGLGVLLGLVLIALFPAMPEQCEPPPPPPQAPTDTREGSAPTPDDHQSVAPVSPSQQGVGGRRRGQRQASAGGDDTGVEGAQGGESLQAALADEGRWVRLFGGGWAKALGLTEGQVRDAVARARAEAAAGAGGGAAAGVGRRGRGGGAAAVDDAAMDYGSLSARVDLVFYLLAFAALLYFVQRDYGGGGGGPSSSVLDPTAAALGGSGGGGGGL